MRAVNAADRRCAEARKLGFTDVVGPGEVGDIAAAIRKALG